MKIHKTLPFLLFACVACQSTRTDAPRATLAADSLLLEVSPAEQRKIATARDAAARAADAYAAAKAAAEEARQAQISSDLDLEDAKTHVERADAAVTRIRNIGTTDDVDTAKRSWDEAKAEHARHAAAAKLAERRTTHARALAEVAREHVAVAEARVELAKAKAVHTLDRPDAQKPSLVRFEESVRRAEADEALARTRADATQREIDVLADAERRSGEQPKN
jgi:hypothetical protein